MGNDCTDLDGLRENEKEVLLLEVDISKELQYFGVDQKMNDYIGVQKRVLPILEAENYFQVVRNNESGMDIHITKKGIKETLGSGKRFQNLPRKLKELKITVLRSLPDIIRTSHLVRDEVPNEHKNSPSYAYFTTPVSINGIVFYVKLTIQKTSYKNKFWIHIIDITEKNSQLLSPSTN